MGVFEFVIVLVVISTAAQIINSAMKSRATQSARMSEGQFQTLCDRLDKLERRMANLETIVLEAEKHKRFDQAL